MSDDRDPAVDAASLQRLHRLGGDSLVSRMIDLFMEHAVRRLEAARAGLGSGEMGEVAHAVHSLKSSAGNLGAHRLHRVAEEIEMHAEQGEAEQVAARFPELESAFAAAHARLRAEREGLPA